MDSAERLKAALIQRNIQGLALDIDETLSHTHEHWFDLLFKFHPLPGKTKEELFHRQEVTSSIPEWQTPKVERFIHETLHSNEFQETVPLIEGADKAVADIHRVIPIVAYITARPDTVRAGTLSWFRKHGFPDAALIMRDTATNLATLSKDKNSWKAGVLQGLYPYVTGIVDDNIALAHELEALHYPGTLYLYGPQSQEFAGHPRVVVCPAWPDVVAAITSPVR
jgi:hypothetical protein